MTKKYYWLKLQESFFKKNEIIMLASHPKGNDFIVFYLKLLLQGFATNGALRFNNSTPYTDDSLATIMSISDVKIVSEALIKFKQYGLISIDKKGTIHVNDFINMTGSETEHAIKKRQYRKGHKEDTKETDSGQCLYIERTNERQCPTEIEKDLDLEIEKEKDLEKDLLITPQPPLKVGEVGNKKNNLKFPTDNFLFNDFWKAYPKKTKIKNAYMWFKTNPVNQELLNQMLEAISRQAKSDLWNRELGRFIPDAINWLKSESWNDILPFEAVEIDTETSDALDEIYRKL